MKMSLCNRIPYGIFTISDIHRIFCTLILIKDVEFMAKAPGKHSGRPSIYQYHYFKIFTI